jgi:uncharacterized membrane protein
MNKNRLEALSDGMIAILWVIPDRKR